MSMKNSLTPAGIETATFRFVAQQNLESRKWIICWKKLKMRWEKC